MPDYGYLNARIKGMKSNLLTKRNYEEMVKKDITTLISELRNTPYKEEIDEALLSTRNKVEGLEEALRKNFAETFKRLLEYSEESAEIKNFISVLLSRWDVYNIKTILRGKNIGASSDEINKNLVPAGKLDEFILSELLEEVDIKSVIDLMATWEIEYAKPLTDVIKEFVKTKNIAVLEIALEKFYYMNCLKKIEGQTDYDSEIVRDFINSEIDITNILTILRLKRENITEAEIKNFLIEGGKIITPKKMKSLLESQNPEEFIKLLEGNIYHSSLKKGHDKYLESGQLSDIQRALEEFLIRKATYLFLLDPLSIGIFIAYMWAKYNEVVNLRILIRGKEIEMPQEMLMGEFVFA